MSGVRREVGRKSSDLLGAQLGSRWDKLTDIELNEMQRLTKSARERNPTFWPEFFSTEDEVQEDGPSQPSRPEVSETSWTPASSQSSTVYDEDSEPTPSAYRCLDPHQETEMRTQPHFHWPGRLQQNGAAKQPVPSAFQQRCADAPQELGFSGAVIAAGASTTAAARARWTIEHGSASSCQADGPQRVHFNRAEDVQKQIGPLRQRFYEDLADYHRSINQVHFRSKLQDYSGKKRAVNKETVEPISLASSKFSLFERPDAVSDVRASETFRLHVMQNTDPDSFKKNYVKSLNSLAQVANEALEVGLAGTAAGDFT